MTSCQSAVGCSHPAALSVSLLAPTGETIESDTGTAPVLKAVASKRLCWACSTSSGVSLMGLDAAIALATALGCHIDVDRLDGEHVFPMHEHLPEQADPITAAKAAADR
jgi:hypothetical protein